MTYNDIYKKFMIEYDKENITSSYPSLTKYEIATILDKAYLALIAQKFTGNNIRKSSFESDIKAIEDLQPLVKHSTINVDDTANSHVNEFVFNINPTNDNYLYFITASLKRVGNNPVIYDPVSLIQHEDAQQFKVSSVNKPWIKTPVAYILNNEIHVFIDAREEKTTYVSGTDNGLLLEYIHKPASFVSNLADPAGWDDITFELNDSMAEELIHLAIVMALGIVESPRITIEQQTRALES